ncbi:hypothetical protein NQZ79_g6344 [Umbelopsis isabellina]|nr:hypothetical protein NQZ79_g6344 [Umbelopsis isabellina]
MPRSRHSRFEYDDVSTLTTFNLDGPPAESDNESVLSKLFLKVKSAVSGPTPVADSTAASISSLSTLDSLTKQYSHHGDTFHHHSSQGADMSQYMYDISAGSSTFLRKGATAVNNNNEDYSRDHSQKSDSEESNEADMLLTVHNVRITSPTPPASRRPTLDVLIPPRNKTNTIANVQLHNNNRLPAAPTFDANVAQEEVQLNLPDLAFDPQGRISIDSTGYPMVRKSSADSDNQSVMTTFSVSNSNSLGRIISRLRGEKRNTEFWMPDEQCKECYDCQQPFNFLRRKHHCRICGQIFCAKCASNIIHGHRINQQGQVRVCKYCLAILQSQEEEDMAMMQESYSYPIQAEPPESLADLSPVVPDQKPPLAPPQMHIQTAKRPTTERGGNSVATLQLEIPEKGYLPPSPNLDPSLSTSSIGPPPSTSTSTHLDNEASIRRFLVDAGNSFLRPRSRANTLTSSQVDNALGILDHRQFMQNGSPVPFRRHSTSPGNHHDAGGGTVVDESEFDPFISDGEDGGYEDDKNPHRVLNFLSGNYERPISNGFAFANINFGAASEEGPPPTPTASTSGLDYVGSEDESFDNKARTRRTEELRGMFGPKDKAASMRRRRSLTTGAVRPVRSKSKSLLRNMQMSPSNITDLYSSDGAPSSPMLTEPLTPGSFLPINSGAMANWLGALDPSSPISTKGSPPFSSKHRRVSSAPTTVELNAGSLDHMRKLVRQLLGDANIPKITDKLLDEWEDVLMNLLLKVSDNVHPNIRGGDEIDIRHYVKIKKIPGGRPKDSSYVKGVVCSKNVAHKQMVRNITNPRILILLFPLEYARVENQLLSLEPVLSQERDHLGKLVARIVALRPTLVIVKSSVSRLALEYLLKANIPVVYNVKLSVIDAVARCTGASIIPSIDKLHFGELSLGHCGLFEIKTLVHSWLPNRRKTFLIFDQCCPDLGGTIILRGGDLSVLRTVKRVVDFMCFVVNNLKLESFLLRDFAKSRNLLPQLSPSNSDTQPGAGLGIDLDGQSTPTKEEVMEPKETKRVEETKSLLATDELIELSKHQRNYSETSSLLEDEEQLKLTNATIDRYVTATLSASPFVIFPPPYLLLRLREMEERLVHLNQQRLLAMIQNQQQVASNGQELSLVATHHTGSSVASNDRSTTTSGLSGVTLAGYPDFNSTLDSEYEHALEDYQMRSRAWESYITESSEVISPFYHQNIVVLYSSVCTETTVPCQGPEIRMFEYYRHQSDVTIGQYIEDLCMDAMLQCPSSMCERPMLKHYRSYAHGSARLNVQIEQFPCPQAGMAHTILMWSFCKICSSPTSVVHMSENTWKYSFGKFLELSFYLADLPPRSDACPHDLYKDHVRYFGLNNFAVRFQYEPIDLLEVFVPPMRLAIDAQVQAAIKESDLENTRSKINKFYDSLSSRNKQFPYDIVHPTKRDKCKDELEELSRRATGEKKAMLQLLQSVYATTPSHDTLSLNFVRMKLQMNVIQWDTDYNDLMKHYFQPERELRRMTATQLKRMFPPEVTGASALSALDLRAQKAAEVADLPLLDIKLDSGRANVYGLAGVESYTDEMPNFYPVPSKLPALGSSPTNSLIIPADESENESEPTNVVEILQSMVELQTQTKSEPATADTALTRRLSMELMKESSVPKRSTKTAPADILNTQANERSLYDSDLLRRQPPMLSTIARKPSSTAISTLDTLKTKQPVPATNSTIASKIPQPPQSMAKKRQIPAKEKANTAIPRERPGRSQKLTQDTQKEESKEIALSGYRYGYRGMTDRAGVDLRRSESMHKPNGASKSTPQVSKSSRSHIRSDKRMFPSLNQHTDDDHQPKSGRFDKPRRTLAAMASRVRGVRQRLPSKASIEVYNTVRELVRDESDDEFQGTDIDESPEREDEVPELLRPSFNRIFSLTRTDEFDESHEFVTPMMSKTWKDDYEVPEGHHIDENEDYFTALPALGSEMDVNKQDAANNLRDIGDVFTEPLPLPSANWDPSSSALSSLVMSDPVAAAVGSGATAPLRIGSGTMTALATTPGITNIPAEETDLSFEKNTESQQSSLIKTIASMLADRGVGSLHPLEYPLSPIEHVFPDSPIIVREDEPSTIIAYTLSCDDYLGKLREIRETYNENFGMEDTAMQGIIDEIDNKSVHSYTSDGIGMDNNDMGFNNIGDMYIERTLRSETGTHVKYHFSDRVTKFFCKIFFSEQFDALRRNLGCDESYLASLASCIKWDSSGGKSGSAFLKTKDDRLLMKQMSRPEMDAFLKFAPAYFQYLSEALFHGLPTVLAKIFGFYRIGYKNAVTGKSMKMDLLVMENLFYQRNVTKIFDLKGSMRNRRVNATGKENEVLLDENLVEFMYQSPLFLRAHSKEILRGSLHNDTLFLSRLNVMDYSLLVGIDETSQELVVGIVDFIRTFTWDKKLESWVKESGILGGGREPTIVTPKQYRLRFKEAMERYFLMVPDFWATRRVRVQHHPSAATQAVDSNL